MTEPIHLLSIEDSPADFQLLERQLRQDGLNVNWQRVDEESALWDALSRGGWDAVLSDYNVPGMDIVATLPRILESHPDLPVVLVSGSIGEEAAVEQLKRGVWDFVLKDRLARLAPAIERALRDAQARRDKRAAEDQLVRLNRLYAVLSGINEAIVRCHDKERLFDECSQIAVAQGGFRMAWVGVLEPDSPDVRPLSHSGEAGDYLDRLRIKVADTRLGRGPTGRALHEGTTTVCNDIAQDERMAPWRENALRMGYRASAAFPIRQGGEVHYALTLYSGQMGYFGVEEVRLLDRLSANISHALDTFDSDAQHLAAKQALVESEARFRAIIDATPVPMALNDDQGNIPYLNSAFIRTFGYTLEDIPTLSDWWPRAYPDPAYRHLVSSNWLIDLDISKREGVPFEPMEANVRCKNGEVRTIIAAAAPLHGTLANLHVVTLFDITERKAAECVIREDREQQARLRELLEVSLDPRPLQETLTLCLERLLTISWLSILPKGGVFLMEKSGPYLELVASHELSAEIQSLCAHVQLGRCHCGRAAASGLMQYAHCVDELHEIHYPGMQEHGHYSVPLVSDETVLGVLVLYLPPGFQRDAQKEQFIASVANILAGLISRKRVEQVLIEHQANLEAMVATRTADLDAARMEAERLARVKSEFLANMSHEIRTPMNAVLGMARIGQRDAGTSTMRQTFNHILNAGQHLLGVINDILDYSKIEAGKMTVEARPFQLATAVDQPLTLMRERAQARGLTLSVDIDAKQPDWVVGDDLRLEQVLLNLLSNAVKFTERGEVSLQLERDGNDTLFRVTDSGIGMTAEALSRLFCAFEQADTSTTRRFGGSGLGLAISRNLANLMGGDITVESAAGAGSVFTLRLPLPAVPPQLEATIARTESNLHLAGLRVLAAEDAKLNRLVLADLLEHEGASVVFAENGQEVLDLLAEHGTAAFDVVLMDLQMPVMDGLEATRRVAEIAPALPVIGLTAHAMAEERAKCLAAGMVDHVTKPIDINTLVAAICRHVSLNTVEVVPSAGIQSTVCDDTEVFDLSVLVDRVGSDSARIAKYTTLFLKTARDTLVEMKAALVSEDMITLSGLAHRMKSTAFVVGAMRFGGICQDLEGSKTSNNLSGARDQVEQLHALLEQVEQRIAEVT
jgi:PAS domain S-box-containing protein